MFNKFLTFLVLAVFFTLCLGQTKSPRPVSKEELARLDAEWRKPRSVEVIKKSLAYTINDDVKNCGPEDKKTSISKIALLATKEWKKLAKGSSVVPGTLTLVWYGSGAQKTDWNVEDRVIPTAMLADFSYLVGKPMCVRTDTSGD